MPVSVYLPWHTCYNVTNHLAICHINKSTHSNFCITWACNTYNGWFQSISYCSWWKPHYKNPAYIPIESIHNINLKNSEQIWTNCKHIVVTLRWPGNHNLCKLWVAFSEQSQTYCVQQNFHSFHNDFSLTYESCTTNYLKSFYNFIL